MEEVVTVKAQAKAAAAKFSARGRVEKSVLQDEIKQLQARGTLLFLCVDVTFSRYQDNLAIRDEELRTALGARAAEGSEAVQAQVSFVH